MWSRDRTGAVATETAVILTVWVTLFVGIFDASSLTMRHNLLSHLARQGARLAIVRGEYSEPELPTWGPATRQGTLSDDSDFARLIRGSLAGMNPGDFTYKLEWIDGGNEIEQRVRVTI
ncbi:MAG: TadE/TadG family type IV pilus assembly protein, partial [Planctomycetaceae bacterium]